MKEVQFILKTVRKRENVTQVELAEKLGIHQQTISRYEAGKKIPQVDTAARIADALGVTLDELVIIREAKEKVADHLKKIKNS